MYSKYIMLLLLVKNIDKPIMNLRDIIACHIGLIFSLNSHNLLIIKYSAV